LHHFGFEPTVVYPKQSKGVLFENLVKQCQDLGIAVLSGMSEEEFARYDLVVDGLFGFSFKGGALDQDFQHLFFCHMYCIHMKSYQ
jgi:NAD(P)H-hydrate repair Nnr-like enzyme with NAD(P)H-hydrate epimerase domain